MLNTDTEDILSIVTTCNHRRGSPKPDVPGDAVTYRTWSAPARKAERQHLGMEYWALSVWDGSTPEGGGWDKTAVPPLPVKRQVLSK